MSISAVTSATSANAAKLDQLNAQLRSTGKSSLGQADFLKLLTTQLANQDPMKPMEDTAFISQMASFSSLEQMQSLNQSFSISSANNFLGKSVTVNSEDNSGTVTGIVTGVTMSDGIPYLLIDGSLYGLDAVESVSLDSSTASVPTTSASTDTTTPAA